MNRRRLALVVTLSSLGLVPGAERGGVIGFRLEGKRVRLDVSQAGAERARLRISSQLLRLARIVDARGVN